MLNKFLLSIIALASLLVLPAQAATISLVADGNAHSLANNVTGTWADTNLSIPIVQVDDAYSALLPANSTIVFSFSVSTGNLSALSQPSNWTATGSYNYDTRDYSKKTGGYYNGSTQSNLTLGSGQTGTTSGYSGGQFDILPAHTGSQGSLALLLSTISVKDAQHGTITFVNNASFTVNIMAEFAAALDAAAYETLKVSYKVTSNISSVPLPSSLPLFIVAFAALGLLAKRRLAARV